MNDQYNSDPYAVLGVSPSASDEEIKDAYRDLAKKYHPDNYAGSPMQDFAESKMSEINAAFDNIMETRRAGGYTRSENPYNGASKSGYNSSFSDIRLLIKQGKLVEAEELLDGIPLNRRDGEWYFLKGSIFYGRGWLEEAYNNFLTACNLSPNNTEYRAALNRMGSHRQGNVGGTGGGVYRQPQNNAGGCSACDICSGLLCADCCCECAGGDLIPCC